MSIVAATGHAAHVVGNLDNGRSRAYEVHFEYNPTDGRRRATVTTFQPVADGALQPAHIYIDESGDMHQRPVRYLLPEDAGASQGSLVQVTEWGDLDIEGIGLGEGPTIDVHAQQS